MHTVFTYEDLKFINEGLTKKDLQWLKKFNLENPIKQSKLKEEQKLLFQSQLCKNNCIKKINKVNNIKNNKNTWKSIKNKYNQIYNN